MYMYMYIEDEAQRMLVQEQQVREGVEEEGNMSDKVHYFLCVSLLCVH